MGEGEGGSRGRIWTRMRSWWGIMSIRLRWGRGGEVEGTDDG